MWTLLAVMFYADYFGHMRYYVFDFETKKQCIETMEIMKQKVKTPSTMECYKEWREE